MSREQKYHAVILKKQPYGEGDELITVFTVESGKLRVMAKSTKFSKSKLQYSLQVLFVTELTLTTSRLPKVIGAEVKQSFAKVRDTYEAITSALYAVELLLKFTPDEEKNEQLFFSLTDFLQFLNSSPIAAYNLGVVFFQINFMQALGLGVHYDESFPEACLVGFSNSRGGFVRGDTVDYTEVLPEVFQLFQALEKATWETLPQVNAETVVQLHELLASFVRYQLERDVSSERFLAM